MTANPVTLSPDADIVDAVHALVRHRISGAPVVDRFGELVGMVSEKDCIEALLHAAYHQQRGGQVAAYMKREVHTVDVDANIADIARQFVEQPYRRYPVISEGRLVGQVSRRDVLRMLTTSTP